MGRRFHQLDETKSPSNMPILTGAQMVKVESAIYIEERFWTEMFMAGLRKLDITAALLSADAALQLHRFMWTKDKEGLSASFAASKAGHEAHWNAGGFGTDNASALPFRRSWARDIWSSAFSREWTEGLSLVSAATQADSALDIYARKIGVELQSLYPDGDATSKARWRSVWDLMDHGAQAPLLAQPRKLADTA